MLKLWEKVHLLPPVMCSMSQVMCHMSHVIYQFLYISSYGKWNTIHVLCHFHYNWFKSYGNARFNKLWTLARGWSYHWDVLLATVFPHLVHILFKCKSWTVIIQEAQVSSWSIFVCFRDNIRWYSAWGQKQTLLLLLCLSSTRITLGFTLS